MTPWERATLALRLLAVDPAGLGGLWLRARSGPVRDRFVAGIDSLPLPRRKIHPQISDEQLYGGVDLSATLGSGRVVWQEGLLARPAAIVLPMAERASPALAARLSAALDRDEGHCLIALDEGAEPDESLPAALTDRLALHLDLGDVALHDSGPVAKRVSDTVLSVQDVAMPERAMADLTVIALRLGIESLRAPMLALRAARAHAALRGAPKVEREDLAAAVELVLAARATRMPEPPPEDTPPPPPEPEADDRDSREETGEDSTAEVQPPQDMLLEAAAAALPADLLARLAAGRAPRRSASASGSGAGKTGNRRGRPLPSRAGRLDGVSRIDLIATLRAAAPWQRIRERLSPRGQGLHVRTSDIRTKRYRETSDRLLIFVVDASGSAAMTRLAEAKGAVELLLGEAYARRDHVALVAFRGLGGDLLLPPTRSLVQTKRRLAALPGGGGTPLAAGLKLAMEVAVQAKGRGMTPTLALLTDGRANIALDGRADRKQAANDAEGIARVVRATETPALVIDMGPRPQPPLRALAEEMAAPYIPLPRADASRLSSAVSAALAG